MPKWTEEQTDAIKKSGSNIIVSAGAGSGKTAVLTERVVDKLLHGVKIENLIILTFTNAAAKEMKDRIRNKINEHEEIKDNLNNLDNAYITTFDSFTLSLVKKYNYLLNVSSNLNIIDSSIISIIKKDYLDEVFLEKYIENDDKFNKLIKDFTIKSDKNIKESILKITESLNLKSNKEEFLNNYIDNYLSEDKINEYIIEYTNILHREIENIETNIMYLESTLYSDYYDNMVSCFSNLINAKSYDEIRRSIPTSIPRRPRVSDDIQEYKESIEESLDNLKTYLRFNNVEEIRESFNNTKDYVESIIDIIKKYYKKIDKYKFDNDLYEFTDIELLAIKLLKDNDEIREEIKNSTYEILVDEYQDTNDLQEEFVSLISNNNVYMVGDIKQSIYGFRNANPKLCKDKYEKYAKNDGGIKIDLLKNFRSRSEVLNGINEIFSLIMDSYIGGADYISSHQMIFGNTNYDKYKGNQNYDFEIYNYQYDKDNKLFTKEEIEAFIIGKDIINKINNKYQVLDGNLRDCTYKDFCIIMDRGTYYTTYKKIFEYLGIPVRILEDKKLTNEIDIILLNNLIGLILKIKSYNLDKEFKYYFMSIARSYLFELDDNTIFNIIKNNSYKDTLIYKKCLRICESLDKLNSYELLINIIDEFDFYKNTIKVGNIEDTIIRVNNLLNIANNLSNMGYTLNDFKEYLDKMINGNSEITYKDTLVESNSVKIMNIHKSKGLEFPICYYSLFHKGFNKEDIKDRFVFDNKYGIITPYFDEGIASTILKDLLKDKYNLDNISEKLRLLYVALTRSKEKMIIVTSLNEDRKSARKLVDNSVRLKYNSFLDIINSISGNLNKYIKDININEIGITKDYMYGNTKADLLNYSNNVINYHSINIDNEIIESKHASKIINVLIDKSTKSKLEYGTKIHKLFETEDFLTSNNDKIKKLVNKFNINKITKIYKEHEFVYESNDVLYHGIIDLVLIDNNIIKIIDYKLKNISDDKYIDQLKVYYEYINKVLNRDKDKIIEVYLYSIIDDKYEIIKL